MIKVLYSAAIKNIIMHYNTAMFPGIYLILLRSIWCSVADSQIFTPADIIPTLPTEPECRMKVTPTSADTIELYEEVMGGYDTRVRPRENQSETVTVEIHFVLNNILKLDDTNQLLAVRGYFYLTWRDEFLSWDPCEDKAVTFLKFSAAEIWTPKLATLEGVGGTKEIYDVADRIIVDSTGRAAWVQNGDFSFFCDFSIRFYPFDRQTCLLTIYPADEGVSEVLFELSKDGASADKDQFKEHSEWELVSLYAGRTLKYGMSMVEITFVMDRRAMFVLYTTLLPLSLLSVLNIFTVLVPVESGEKCSIAVTLFMAYGVILTFISGGLPHNSLDVSYFILYGIGLLVYSIIVVIYAILQSRIYTCFGDDPVTICNSCRFWKKKSMISPAVDNSKASRSIKEDSRNTTSDNLTWKKFLGKLDVVFFFVCLLLYSVASAALLTAVKDKTLH